LHEVDVTLSTVVKELNLEAVVGETIRLGLSKRDAQVLAHLCRKYLSALASKNANVIHTRDSIRVSVSRDGPRVPASCRVTNLTGSVRRTGHLQKPGLD